jgi:hypothetical protein
MKSLTVNVTDASMGPRLFSRGKDGKQAVTIYDKGQAPEE